jgi:hypothetical protein
MVIYDHNENEVKQIQNDGTGFQPVDEVQIAMREEAEKARNNGNMERWRNIHIRLAGDDIARK